MNYNNNYNLKVKVQPNPANQSVNVKYELAENADSEIILLDGIGKVVRHVKKQKQLAGKNEETITTADLHEGVYFMIVKTGSHLERKTVYINH